MRFFNQYFSNNKMLNVIFNFNGKILLAIN
jgi:hypothetical protein